MEISLDLQAVKDRIENAGLTIKEVALKIKERPSTLNSMLNGDKPLTRNYGILIDAVIKRAKGNAWTGKESVSVNKVIEFLNNTLKLDRVLIQEMLSKDFYCDKSIYNHKSIQTKLTLGYDDIKLYSTSFLGVLNGLFGVDENGFGAIAAIVSALGRVEKFMLVDTDKISKEMRDE